MDISVIVPIFEEKDNVAILHKRIVQTLKKIAKTHEIIFIDDGSRDGTFSQLQKLKDIKIIKFRKNFGQTAAMKAGFDEAKGDIIISMDGDLQNDPADIPKLLAKIAEGYDVVSGWRYNRKDTFGKKMFSKIADKMRRMLINDQIHDSGCSLKAYKKECFENIELMGEMHRYIPAILSLEGFKIGEVKVRHYARKYGKTKYGITRVLKGFLDLLNVWFWRKYAARPMHIFGLLGISFISLGSISGFTSIYLRIFHHVDLSNTFLPTVATVLFIIGVQFFVSGIMTDIMIKSYYHSNNKKTYNIETIIERK